MRNFDYLKDIPELGDLYGYCNTAELTQQSAPDTSALNALLARMDDAHCLEEASLLFVQAIHVPEDNPAVPEFEELLKKYFEP